MDTYAFSTTQELYQLYPGAELLPKHIKIPGHLGGCQRRKMSPSQDNDSHSATQLPKKLEWVGLGF
jgi:hypothetical protein